MGFLTPANHIITAAHCLPRLPAFDCDAETVLVDVRDQRHPDRISRLIVTSVDPCSDVAVLTEHDYTPYRTSFYEMIQGLKPAPLALDEPGSDTDVRVHVRTHLGEWLSGTGKSFGPPRNFLLVILDDSSARIIEGTSGAPVFDDTGRVLAIVSQNDGDKPGFKAVRLATALPRWVLIDEAKACPKPE
jgi:hypothetical protein